MKPTALFCTTIVIAATIWDVIVLQIGGTDLSISRWFTSFENKPMVVFGCGFLSGHFFGGMYRLPANDKSKIV